MNRTLIMLATVAACTQRLPAQLFDASAQFSATSNPNSVWRYGFEAAPLGSSFTLFNIAGSYVTNAIDSWSSSSLGTYPQINHNHTGNTFTDTNPNRDIVWEPDELSLHPGPAGQFSVLRFLASAADTYQITVSFQGIDHQGASTDVHVLTNDVSLFDHQVTGFHAPVSFSATLALAQNDKLDFAVGYGANGNYFQDNTGTHAVVVGSRPQLSASILSGSRAQMAWATNFTGYALEYTKSFPATGWTSVTNSVIATGGRFSIVVDTEDPQQFFRLPKGVSQ